MRIDYKSGSYYIGDVNDNQEPHGKGTFYRNNGDITEGDFVNGYIEGYAVTHFSNGDIYEGEYKSGKRHGVGRYIFAKSGNIYEGGYEDGHMQGYGTFYYNGGDVYEGQFDNGYYSGLGVYFYHNSNDRYVGHFTKDTKHGMGTYHYGNGDVFIGAFSQGKKHGHGVYYFPSDNKRVGEWINGEKSSTNKMFPDKSSEKKVNYTDGSYYLGEVNEAGNPHGYGTWYYAQGDRYEGNFANGKRHGVGRYHFSNGNRYEGQFDNGAISGFGTYYYTNGDIYEGNYKNGKRCGAGISTYSNGAKYLGNFENDVKHGKGVYCYSNGDRFVGEWKEGKRVDGSGKTYPKKETNKGTPKATNPGKPQTLFPNKYVFISYKAEEKDYAEALKLLLNEYGIKTWMAPGDIPTGVEYAVAIKRAITDCSCVLLILSNQSQASRHVRSEVRIAFDAGKNIISAHIDSSNLTDAFDYYLGNDHITPLTTSDKNDPNVKKIIDDIKSVLKSK